MRAIWYAAAFTLSVVLAVEAIQANWATLEASVTLTVRFCWPGPMNGVASTVSTAFAGCMEAWVTPSAEAE